MALKFLIIVEYNVWMLTCALTIVLVVSVLAGSEKNLALEHCKSLVVLMDVSLKSYIISEQAHSHFSVSREKDASE